MVAKPKPKNNQQLTAIGYSKHDVNPAESYEKNREENSKKHK